MIKEAVINYFQEQQATIFENWQAAKAEHDVDALHDLRVGIKRLKALYQLLEPLSSGAFDYKAHFEDIRRLFKAVGRLRDLQVQQQLFSSLIEDEPEKTYHEFINYLKALQAVESVELKKALESFNPEVMQDSLNDVAMFLEGYEENLAISITRKHLKKRLKQIKQLLPQKKEEEKMHEMRTRVKQSICILDLLQLIRPGIVAIKHPKDIKGAGDSLGQWHDHVVLADQIAAFLALAAEEDNEELDGEPYVDLMFSIKKEAKKLLKEARKILKKHSLKVLK